MNTKKIVRNGTVVEKNVTQIVAYPKKIVRNGTVVENNGVEMCMKLIPKMPSNFASDESWKNFTRNSGL